MPMNKESLVSGSKKILGSRVGNWGIFIFLILGAYYFGTCNGGDTWRDKYEAFRDSAQVAATTFSDSVENVADSLVTLSDSTATIAEEQTDSIEELKDSTTTLQENFDAIEVDTTPVVVNDLPAECTACAIRLNTTLSKLSVAENLNTNLNSIVVRLEERDVNRLNSIVLLRTAVFTEKFRADSLQSVIFNMPEPEPPPRLFGLLNIGPTESFLAGVGAIFIIQALTNK